MDPLIIDPSRIRPLPQSMWDSSCSNCDRRQSRWEFLPSDADAPKDRGLLMCSLCWLYESEWGKKRREGLDQMVVEVEASTGQSFLRAPDGRLLLCKDADRIMGAIALTSRMFVYRGVMARKAEAEDEHGA